MPAADQKEQEDGYHFIMKIQIEIDTALQESELRIRCPEINEEITLIQKMISELDNSQTQMIFYQNDTEF